MLRPKIGREWAEFEKDKNINKNHFPTLKNNFLTA